MPTLLGADTGIGAGRIDKGHDRAVELFRHPHEAKGLPIPFRIGHAEVALHAFFESLAFLMTDNHHRSIVESGKSSHDGPIISEHTVAVQLEKISCQLIDIIQRAWALRVAGQLRSLPGGQVFVELVFDLRQLGAQLPDVVLRRRLAAGGRGG